MSRPPVHDEMLNDMLSVEERNETVSYSNGVVAGRASGWEEGILLGHKHGTQLGSEVGFYTGFAELWKDLLSVQGESDSKKFRSVCSLLSMGEEFPFHDPQNPEIHEKMTKIRAKFKQVSSQLNINVSFQPQVEGLSF